MLLMMYVDWCLIGYSGWVSSEGSMFILQLSVGLRTMTLDKARAKQGFCQMKIQCNKKCNQLYIYFLCNWNNSCSPTDVSFYLNCNPNCKLPRTSKIGSSILKEELFANSSWDCRNLDINVWSNKCFKVISLFHQQFWYVIGSIKLCWVYQK